jgi:uncharacterized protein (TIGR00255 family)
MSLSGMTGFAREEGGQGAWTWSVEARSVNGRNLEARFRGPPGFDGLELLVREAAQARFQRGQINVGVHAKRADSAGAVRINTEQLERYIDAAERYVRQGRAAAPAMDGLFALRGVIEVADDTDDAEVRAAIEAAMAQTLATALDGLKRSRQEEGAALTPVLLGLVERVEALVGQAEAEAREQPALVKERFAKRLAELLDDRPNLEALIVQEAAMLATKADVREELDRLTSHVQAARALIAGEAVAGRRLDFLAQEFMREANTLCSKSATNTLTTIGLELKATIEQFREQVQNVE